MSTSVSAQLAAMPRAARVLVREILVHGPQARTELARTLDLTLGSLTRLTKPLIDLDVLVETPALRGVSHGRPRLPLDVAADRHQFVGVKLTAHDLYAVVTDLRARVLAEHHVDLPDTRPEAVCAEIGRAVGVLGADSARVRGVGVTVGGHTRDQSVVVRAPFLGWEDLPFAELVTAQTGLPTVVDNDVVGLTAFQHWFGVARGLEQFALVTIGAGVGYGLVVHNRVVRSAGADLSGIGPHQLDTLGPMNGLGQRGTVASYLTADAITATAGLALGRAVEYDEVVTLAEQGDPACGRVVVEAGQALGRLVAAIASVALTDRVILSGEGIRLAQVAWPALQESLAGLRPRYAPPVTVDVEPMAFSEWARGAAVLAIQDFVTTPEDREAEVIF